MSPLLICLVCRDLVKKPPIETCTNVTTQKLAKYIVTLLDELDEQDKDGDTGTTTTTTTPTTFFGCRSGASTVLALLLDHPDRVRNVMPHECPTENKNPRLGRPTTQDDQTMIKKHENHGQRYGRYRPRIDPKMGSSR